MWKRKKTASVHIEIGSAEKEFYAFEKTPLYELTADMLITVPASYTATVYFEYGDPVQVPPCSQKKLMKAANIGKDKIGEKFYIIFNNPGAFSNYSWGAGNIHLRFEGISFSMGAGGFFDIRMTDVNKYISTLGRNESRVYSTENVNSNIQNIINVQTGAIISQLIKESGTMTVNNTFLVDELNFRLHDFFIRDDYFEQYGVAANNIYAVRILTNDINHSHTSQNPRTAVNGGMRPPQKRTKPPTSIGIRPARPKEETAETEEPKEEEKPQITFDI